MYLLLIFLPLVSFLLCISLGFKIGSSGCQILSVSILGLAFFLSIISFYEVCICKSICIVKLSNWIDSSYLQIKWAFLFDSLTCCMVVVVYFISTLVHIYSIDYMKSDPHIPRFMSYLSLFTFFMIILITSNNLIQLFVGWEGVGVCSYLLINFWFSRIQANKSALKAMFINKIGDIGLILGICLSSYGLGCLNFLTMFSLIEQISEYKMIFLTYQINFSDMLSFLFFIGVIGKSAQFGLHIWLPDAMEGPTPVSALIHAATMVTAGIFLILRCCYIFESSNLILKIMCYMGSLTCIFAATVALVQNDLKKVIAYSTCSQLGYMLFICGFSSYTFSFYHLVNHAFFKAALFLGAGSIIHSLSDEQDFRRMGELKKLLPFTYSIIMVGSLSLMGFPFLSGFYSKDAIIELSFVNYSVAGNFCFFMACLGAMLTSYYSLRLICLVFFSKNRSYRLVLLNLHESSNIVCFTLSILMVPSLFSGYFLKEMFVGYGSNFWSSSIYLTSSNTYFLDLEFIIEGLYKQLPLVVSIIGSLLSFAFYNIKNFRNIATILLTTRTFNRLYTFISKKWFVDQLYNNLFNQTWANLSFKATYKDIDKGFIEFVGPTGVSKFLTLISSIFRLQQSGNYFDYIVLMFFFLNLIIIFFYFFYSIVYFSYDVDLLFIILNSYFVLNWNHKTEKKKS